MVKKCAESHASRAKNVISGLVASGRGYIQHFTVTGSDSNLDPLPGSDRRSHNVESTCFYEHEHSQIINPTFTARAHFHALTLVAAVTAALAARLRLRFPKRIMVS